MLPGLMAMPFIVPNYPVAQALAIQRKKPLKISKRH
jgi:hypothetical protein